MVEQRHTLVDAIGYAPTRQRRLEETVLLVGAVEDGKVLPLGTLTRPVLDVHRHLHRLVAILQYPHKAYLLAHLRSRKASFLQSARVVGYE